MHNREDNAPDLVGENGQIRCRGNRAAEVAGFFLRLNGFFLISDFVIHHDSKSEFFRTDADFVGVRFSGSVEKIGGRKLADFSEFSDWSREKVALVVLCEVKAGICAVNDSWQGDRGLVPLTRVVERLGVLPGVDVSAVARKWLDQPDGAVSSNKFRFQWICIGTTKSTVVSKKQISFEQIADFFYDRFDRHRELKLPESTAREVFQPWGAFGTRLARLFQSRYCERSDVTRFVAEYIEHEQPKDVRS